MKEKYIVVFDSGVGGLTVLRSCVQRCPQERFAYFGDNGNAPYGNRSTEEICFLALRAFNRIARMHVRAAILACNTVTAACVDNLRSRFDFPVFGIEPAVKPASALGGKVLLLATRATLSCRRVQRLIRVNSSGAEIFPFSPVDLAGEIEKNVFNLSRVRLERHLPQGNYDSVVLGCTHYVFLKKRIEEFYGCPVFDGGAGTADHVAKVLNVCSQNTAFLPEKQPVFWGKFKKYNRNAYNTLA